MTDRQTELERRFGKAGGGPVRFPPGEEIRPSAPFVRELLAEIDELLRGGSCPEGRLELETADAEYDTAPSVFRLERPQAGTAR